MFILDGFNNHSGSNTNGAIFILGTGKLCYGALLATIGIEGDKSVTIPLPQYQGDIATLNVEGLSLRRVDAIEIGGYRYSRATGELQPGQFFWDASQKIILIKLAALNSQ